MTNFTLHDGSVVRVVDTMSRRFDVLMARRGRRATSHMRVGRFAVATLDDQTLAIGRMYDGPCDDGSIAPGSRHWDDHRRDRTKQLDHVILRLQGHPLQAEVATDVAEERLLLARVA